MPRRRSLISASLIDEVSAEILSPADGVDSPDVAVGASSNTLCAIATEVVKWRNRNNEKAAAVKGLIKAGIVQGRERMRSFTPWVPGSTKLLNPIPEASKR